MKTVYDDGFFNSRKAPLCVLVISLVSAFSIISEVDFAIVTSGIVTLIFIFLAMKDMEDSTGDPGAAVFVFGFLLCIFVIGIAILTIIIQFSINMLSKVTF